MVSNFRGQSPQTILSHFRGLSPEVAYSALLMAAVLLGMSPNATAAMREVASEAPASDRPTAGSPTRPIATSPRPPLSLLAGVSILKGEVGALLAARVGLPKNLSLELGGVLPHPADRYASDTPIGGAFTTSGHTRSYSESHIALILPFYQERHVSIEGGVGLSLGNVGYDIRQSSLGGTVEVSRLRTQLSPWVELGAAWHVTPRFSLLLRTLYVRYEGSVFMTGESLSLGFSGVAIEPMMVVRF